MSKVVKRWKSLKKRNRDPSHDSTFRHGFFLFLPWRPQILQAWHGSISQFLWLHNCALLFPFMLPHLLVLSSEILLRFSAVCISFILLLSFYVFFHSVSLLHIFTHVSSSRAASSARGPNSKCKRREC